MSEDKFNERDDFDALISDVFKEDAQSADARVWENISAELQGKKKRRGVAWWWYGAAASMALLLGWSFWPTADLGLEKASPAYSLEDSEQESTLLEKEAASSSELDGDEASPSGTDGMANQEFNATQKPSLENGHQTSRLKELTSNALASEQRRNAQSAEPPSMANAEPSLNKEESLPFGIIKEHKRTRSVEWVNVLASLEWRYQAQEIDSVNHREYPDALRFAQVPKMEEDLQPLLAANLGSSSGGNSMTPVSASFTNGNDQLADFESEVLPTADLYNGRTDITNFDQQFNVPFSIGGRFSLPISTNWYVETGLSYARLGSSISYLQQGEDMSFTEVQHYIGIPVMLRWQLVNRPKLSLSTIQGWQIDKGIATRIVGKDDLTPTFTDLGGGYQLGLTAGLSLEYRFADQLGLYLQPSFTNWSIGTRGLRNIRNQNLIWPELQLGIRYRLK